MSLCATHGHNFYTIATVLTTVNDKGSTQRVVKCTRCSKCGKKLDD